MSEKGKILYSTDGSGKNLILNEKKEEKLDSIISKEVTLKLRIEKNGRGGKIVSVIYNLPNNPPYFKELAKKLKNHCGSGGSFQDDTRTIEIQGDHLAKIKAYLLKLEFLVKG